MPMQVVLPDTLAVSEYIPAAVIFVHWLISVNAPTSSKSVTSAPVMLPYSPVISESPKAARIRSAIFMLEFNRAAIDSLRLFSHGQQHDQSSVQEDISQPYSTKHTD